MVLAASISNTALFIRRFIGTNPENILFTLILKMQDKTDARKQFIFDY